MMEYTYRQIQQVKIRKEAESLLDVERQDPERVGGNVPTRLDRRNYFVHLIPVSYRHLRNPFIRPLPSSRKYLMTDNSPRENPASHGRVTDS